MKARRESQNRLPLPMGRRRALQLICSSWMYFSEPDSNSRWFISLNEARAPAKISWPWPWPYHTSIPILSEYGQPTRAGYHFVRRSDSVLEELEIDLDVPYHKLMRCQPVAIMLEPQVRVPYCI